MGFGRVVVPVQCKNGFKARLRGNLSLDIVYLERNQYSCAAFRAVDGLEPAAQKHRHASMHYGTLPILSLEKAQDIFNTRALNGVP